LEKLEVTDLWIKTTKRIMTATVKAIPEGHHTITPYLVVKNGAQAIEFYKNAFGAEESFRMNGPDGKSIVHAQLKDTQ
jgi:PhnB protein